MRKRGTGEERKRSSKIEGKKVKKEDNVELGLEIINVIIYIKISFMEDTISPGELSAIPLLIRTMATTCTTPILLLVNKIVQVCLFSFPLLFYFFYPFFFSLCEELIL
jgi:hypothetical protein